MRGLDVWPSCVIPDCSDTQVVFYPEAQNTVNTFTALSVVRDVTRAGDFVLGSADFSCGGLPNRGEWSGVRFGATTKSAAVAPYQFMAESGEALVWDVSLVLRSAVQ